MSRSCWKRRYVVAPAGTDTTVSQVAVEYRDGHGSMPNGAIDSSDPLPSRALLCSRMSLAAGSVPCCGGYRHAPVSVHGLFGPASNPSPATAFAVLPAGQTGAGCVSPAVALV